MATCNNVEKIEQSEFLANSLFKINNNYINLDTGLCGLGNDLLTLEGYIKSLSTRNSRTVQSFISLNQYALSANVIDNSIGTLKLGIDIPQTTKVFLTAVKTTSLVDDISLVNVRNENSIRWDGTKWVNTGLVDEIGARYLYEFKDTLISNNLVGRHVLKYNALSGIWQNTEETGLSAIPNGNYEDISVLGEGFQQGLTWKINPNVVDTLELADGTVTTQKINNLEITNDKFEDNTIQFTKCAFPIGQVNVGRNRGTSAQSAGIYADKSGTTLQFKSLRGVGCQITSFNDKIFLDALQPPAPLPPTGENLTGTGARPLREITPQNIFRFRSFRAGGGIQIEQTDDEITISRPIAVLGISLPNVNDNGDPLSTSDIVNILNQIFRPEDFYPGTVCNVRLINSTLNPTTTFNINIPLTLKYRYTRNCSTVVSGICGGSCVATTTTCNLTLLWLDPITDFVPPSKGAPLVTVTGTKTINDLVTAPLPATPVISLSLGSVRSFRITSGTWASL